MPLQLRDDLHWCDCLGRAVFLDLANDRYFCLPSSLNDAFLHVARGKQELENSALSQSLVECGILVENVHGARSTAPVNIEPIKGDLSSGEHERISLVRMLSALVAEMRVSWSLYRRPLRDIIALARRQPSRRRNSDPARTSKAIVAGANAAALVTRSNDRCLVRALAVHAACKNVGIRSKLVFGVIANPFAAHCWVQFGSTVLVGGFEQARLYTPIMIVE